MSLRIVGGSAGGRRLRAPAGRDTRPTADRTREALFSTLATLAEPGGRFLDLYAGSGAVGLEARSRGAAAVTLVEHDSKALRVLRENVAALGLGECTVLAGGVRAVLARGAEQAFDVLFADPPYALPAGELTGVLRLAAAGGWLAADAVVVVERAGRDADWVWPEGFAAVQHRRYGEATLWYGRHVATAPGVHPG
jgi:16S rRNA (guanine966-N2)-methyltransferase